MRRTLLIFDGIVNLSLGVLLLWFPTGVVTALGVPSGSPFYANLLGSVLVGVGIALLIERFRVSGSPGGLGLAGAIAINLCGGLVLVAWLLFGDLQLSQLGVFLLWAIALVLLVLSLMEASTKQ